MATGSIAPADEDGRTDDGVSNSRDAPASIASDVAAIGRLPFVSKMLDILCKVTGMRFAVVARVTENTWTCCAVKDDISFGIVPGSQLDVETTLCLEVHQALQPVVFDRASTDPRYQDHPSVKRFNFESYISVPILLPGGRYFGNLCALDPEHAPISEPRMVAMFQGFAELLALQLDDQLSRENAQNALRDERARSELREQFIAILGHDLRNPLQAVYATANLLERRLADTVLSSMATRIKGNVRRMSSLIDDVLDFARARLGGGIGVRLEECNDVEGALIGVVEELQDARPERRIVLDSSVTRTLWCDISRVQQVVSNLIANAVTHGSANGPIKVSLSNTDDYLVLQVWNDGEPIPHENIGKMFEPFWRQSSAGDRQGLGLGLHICAQIVNAHGGDIVVTSSREAGTLFTVRLPLRRPAGTEK